MRFMALFKMQLLEIRRNPIMGMIPMLVIVLSLIWSLVGDSSARPYMITAAMLMGPYMVGLQLPAQSLAEEKEKRTLEALFLTPARPMEVIGSKLAATTLLAAVAILISLAIFRTPPANPAVLTLAFLMGLSLNMSIATVIGLMAPDQKTAGVLAVPVMILLLFGAMMPWQVTLPQVWDAMEYLPTRPMFELFQVGVIGADHPVLKNVLIMLPYMAVPLYFAVRQIRRQASNR